MTRLADRLVASEHVARSGDPEHRGAVTLSLTPRGHDLVARVATWRRRELGGIVAQLSPGDRDAAVRALRQLVDAAAPGYGPVIVGLMPL